MNERHAYCIIHVCLRRTQISTINQCIFQDGSLQRIRRDVLVVVVVIIIIICENTGHSCALMITILYSWYNFVLWIQRSVLKWQWMPEVLLLRQRDSEYYAGIWSTHTNEPRNSNTQVRNFTCIPIESQPDAYVVSSQFLFPDCSVLLQLLQTRDKCAEGWILEHWMIKTVDGERGHY